MKRISMGKGTRQYHAVRILAVLTLAAVMAAGCSAPGGPKGAAQAQLQVRAVKTEPVAKQRISDPAEQVADISAGTAIDIATKANGEVIEVLKKRGDYVEKGEVLFRVDSKDAESAKRKNELAVRSSQESLQKAKDDQINNRKDLADAVQKAETALKNAQQDYNKMRNDYDNGLASDHQLEQAQQQVDNARMSLESAQNKLAANDNNNTIASAETQAETNQLALEDSIRALDNYNVKAPASGVLTDFTPEVGQTVNTASKLGQVLQIDPVKITTELSETNMKLVKNKKELVYYSPDNPDKKGTAQISYLAPVMSAQTKTYTLELEVANPDHTITPGTRVMVQLTTEEEEKVVVVPTLSIIREESDAFVFVQQGDTYQKRKIKLGRINGSYQEVLDGVKEGEQLVVTGQHQLKDGQKVEAASAAPSPSPAPAGAAPDGQKQAK
ncbi:efflux RND transporter periplasmic adaptor subunit [Paenibacillus doosanensis]|uniref:Cation efflux system protein CusB n=1 Tax=Paenibacillus konkukensis TaxID=2020716 RepID=A0ABY4RN21_9BACL|nr:MULTISPECIES: efflux RND transporter periplasmic adaptor subunit [Paenibacillus]MCS7461716.1 efflux RND transporter periplasmic adaptor subunit [Paenibacillus doosanensis]UQZ83558.1 Cation efflux system protein CusB precursor [Paenibacillus konkukensis]